MGTLTNTSIIAFCEKIATTHPAIAHNGTTLKRFFSFNGNRLLAEEKSKLNFETLLMGLGLPDRSSVSWTIKDTGTQTQKLKYFDLVVCGKFPPSDYDAEDVTCEAAEAVLDHILTWMYDTMAGENKCDWPLLEYIDMENIVCRREKNIGMAEMSGAVMRVPLRDWIRYDADTNPLNNMEP